MGFRGWGLGCRTRIRITLRAKIKISFMVRVNHWSGRFSIIACTSTIFSILYHYVVCNTLWNTCDACTFPLNSLTLLTLALRELNVCTPI